MSIIDELRDAEMASDQETFRNELLESVQLRAPNASEVEDIEFAFVCEIGSRLSDAEEFQEFIPCHFLGTGYRGKKIRVDGYEIDEADDSVRLLIADYKGTEELETITRSRAETIFSQLKGFVDESVSGRSLSSTSEESAQTKELLNLLEQRHSIRPDGTRGVSRYRFYLITDSILSDRVKDLHGDELDGVPVEYHIWDVSRLFAVSKSILGTEELVIDISEFEPTGLPCLRASETDEYDGYLCVITGDALAEMYDRYGSRLLEGNVRSFLGTGKDINRKIQGTIRGEPGHFFVYNNGISATATAAKIDETDGGPRLMSVKYLQIVNGGQTTASLHIAKRKDKADLKNVHVQMKLSVVKATDSDKLDTMIQNIAKFSNSQNKVSEADFFSNHPFHRAIERRSRSVKAPTAQGAQFNTYWFYERTRGQYNNEQSKMTHKQKKDFQRENPKSQLISKTDLAKYENSWRKLPHFVSQGAQKNFKEFARYIDKEFGADGRKFDNDNYFKDVVAKAIIFKFTEQMVSQAKSTWYGGDYRAQIVTYTLAKLVDTLDKRAVGRSLNLGMVWSKQRLSHALAMQLEEIAKIVSKTITNPPVAQMNIGEWCKKDYCWITVFNQEIDLLPELTKELISLEEVEQEEAEGIAQGAQDAAINSVIEVVHISSNGGWKKLQEWNQKTYAMSIVGTEADLIRLAATKNNWIPTDKQAYRLIQTFRRAEELGFRM
jgi:hypothetical protein